MPETISINSILHSLRSPHTQFCVPKWQRKYRWGKPELRQLVFDLVAVAEREDNSPTHFGGVLITSTERTAPGAVTQRLVVDGQQRLTTISLLLHSISQRLQRGEDGGLWTEDRVRGYIENAHATSPQSKYRLRLQDGDDEEYIGLLNGDKGRGKISAAFAFLQSETAKHSPNALLRGMDRLRVIAFACGENDDPQQIFESLNATGIALSQSEKVKNWLLMGASKPKQEEIYDRYWIPIMKRVGGDDGGSRPIDNFIADYLKWQTGVVGNQNYLYTHLKRWWHDGQKEETPEDRAALAEDLCSAAALYEKIIGRRTHENKRIEARLKTLRGIGIDVHRPLTLRLLHDHAHFPEHTGATASEVILTLEAIATWLVRIWCADKRTAGLRNIFAQLAHVTPSTGYSVFWISQIRDKEFSAFGMPDKAEIMAGFSKHRELARSPGSVAAKTVLWGINAVLSEDVSPSMDELTIEHVMPRKLNDHWKKYLGDGSEEYHARNMNTVANITLVGQGFNAKLSNRKYHYKRSLYRKSTVELTRRIARDFSGWKAADLQARCEVLAEQVLLRWPWEYAKTPSSVPRKRWRLNGGAWQQEKSYRAVLVNVVAALLSKNKERNSERLLGRRRVTVDLHPAEAPPRGENFAEIPGHEEYVIYTKLNARSIRRHCEDYGRRCEEDIEVE